MNNYYEYIIIGASKSGLEYLDNLDKAKNICIVSKDFEQCAEQYKEVKYIQGEVVYMSYYHGLTTLELKDHSKISGVNIIIATELRGDCKSEFYYKNDHKVPNKAQNLAIFGNSDKAAAIAVTLAKLAKNVYILSPDGKMKMSPGERLKVVNTKNIYWMPLSKYTIIGDEAPYLIKLEQDEIEVNQIFDFPAGIPDTDFVPDMLVQKEDKYILTKENGQTTIVPTIFAIGSCAKIMEV